MNLLNSITVTDIEEPVTVHSEKGRVFEMQGRPAFGLSFCMSGQITYTMNGKTFVSDPGCAVLLPKGGVYSLYGDREGLFPLIDFQGEHLDCEEIQVFPLSDPQECIKDFETLKNLFLFAENRLKIYAAFYDLLSKVALSRSPEHRPLSPVIRYIEEHLSSPELANAALAREMGISEVYLRKLFLTHYRTTPKQYVLDLRIRKAKQRLTDTPFTVTAIAEECGFSSVYHFCRAFKQKTGVTPTEYAATHKIDHL